MDIHTLLDPGYWQDIVVSKWRQIVSFNKKAQVVLLEDLISQLESGVPSLDAFILFSKNYEGDTKEVCQSVIRALNEGKSLADGLEGWFPDEIITSVRVGEERGVLVRTLRNVIEYLEASSAGISLFVSKTAYPLMIVVMAFVMATYVNDGFYKVVEAIKPKTEWPEDSVIIYGFWEFLLNQWWLLLAVFLVCFQTISYQLSNLTGDLRSTFDSLPIFKHYRLQQSSVFLKTLGLLLQNGTSLNESLKEIERGATKYMASHLRRMRQKLATGDGNEGDVLNTGLLEQETINRLRTLADVNDFESAMVRLGDQTLISTIKRMETASEVYKYVSIAISGALIASVFLGSFSLSQSLG